MVHAGDLKGSFFLRFMRLANRLSVPLINGHHLLANAGIRFCKTSDSIKQEIMANIG